MYNYYITHSFKYHHIKYRNLQNCFFIQFNCKNRSSFFTSTICSAIRNTRFRSGRRLSYISLSLRKSRPFIFACESRRCIGYPDSESPSPLYLLLLLFRLLFLHPSTTFLASEPGASDQMEFFHFIFPALCTISNSIVPAFIPAHFRAVFHVHTRTFVFHLAIR